MVAKSRVLVSLLIVVFIIALLGGSCARGIKEGVSVEKERPAYGGIITLGVTADPPSFDDAIQPQAYCGTLAYTHEDLLMGDWTKGKAGGYGTGECAFQASSNNRLKYATGCLAESWEIQGRDTIILHLRKGVRWHNKPPTNGRELTADDVVFSLKRQCTLPTAYFKRTYPRAAESTEISATDPYTVVIKCRPENFVDVVTVMLDFMKIYPRDAIEQFGDMNDPKNSIGSGPFVLTEFVASSVASYVRNPDYWGKNPIGPGKGDQLPYVDGIKVLNLGDESTVHSAFRTGQLDWVAADWEQAQEYLRMPQLKHISYIPDAGQACIYMRTDKKDSPFADKRVRQALWLGIDHKKIVDDYYGGNAVLLKWPVTPAKEFADIYVPLEQMPRSVQELFEYHPDKAKQLLAEAGYPNGFKTKIICYNSRVYMEPLQLVKDMWAKIGVELVIEPKDLGTHTSLSIRRAYDEMFFGGYAGAGTYMKAINYTGPGMYNGSYVNDPILNKARDEMLAAYPDEAKVAEIHRQMLPYLLEQAYVIALPAPYWYVFWWPWLKNYDGQLSLGYYNGSGLQYAWIDQELKKSILGK